MEGSDMYCAVYIHNHEKKSVPVSLDSIYLLDDSGNYTIRATEKEIKKAKLKYGSNTARMKYGDDNVPITILAVKGSEKEAQEYLKKRKRPYMPPRRSIIPQKKNIQNSNKKRADRRTSGRILKKKSNYLKTRNQAVKDKVIISSEEIILRVERECGTSEEIIANKTEGENSTCAGDQNPIEVSADLENCEGDDPSNQPRIFDSNDITEKKDAEISNNTRQEESFTDKEIRRSKSDEKGNEAAESNEVPYINGICDHGKFDIVEVPGDGDCMFHSVIGALGLEINSSKLKQVLKDSDVIPLSDEELRINIATPGKEGDEKTLSVISKHFKIGICIHYLEIGGSIAYLKYPVADAMNEIHLSYTVSPSSHYNYLRCKQPKSHVQLNESSESSPMVRSIEIITTDERTRLLQKNDRTARDIQLPMSKADFVELIETAIQKALRSEFQKQHQNPQMSVQDSCSYSKAQTNAESLESITEKVQISYGEMAKIIRAQSLRKGLNFLISIYWPQKEVRNKLYFQPPKNVQGAMKVEEVDIQEIERIMEYVNVKRMKLEDIKPVPEDKDWKTKYRHWITKKLSSDRDVMKREKNDEV